MFVKWEDGGDEDLLRMLLHQEWSSCYPWSQPGKCCSTKNGALAIWAQPGKFCYSILPWSQPGKCCSTKNVALLIGLNQVSFAI